MKNKIVASAETLASLDLLIADKEAGKADFADEFYRIIVIIVEGGLPFPHVHVQDYPVASVLDKVSDAIVSVLKHASVEELIEFKGGLEEASR